MATRAPVRVSSALIPSVVPWTKKSRLDSSAPAFANPEIDAAGRVRRNRLDLLVAKPVPVVAEQHDVGERSSYVDRDAHSAPG